MSPNAETKTKILSFSFSIIEKTFFNELEVATEVPPNLITFKKLFPFY